MAGHVLSDTQPNAYQTPNKIGVIAVVYWEFTIGATGAVSSVDTDITSTGAGVTRTTTGRYALTFPGGGRKKVWHGGALENDDTSPAQAEGNQLLATAINVAAGTMELQTIGSSGLADPPSGSKISYKLEVRV